MENNCEEFEDDSILYELLEYFVKKQDPELIKWKNDTAILPTPGTIKNALRYLNNRYSLPESISQQISLTLPWKFSIDPNGRLLALLLDNSLEIRKSKDEFSSVISKATVPKDAFPQWRKLSWSPDASLLVLASSNGSLSFYNSLGNNIFTITPRTVSQNPEILEAGDAISSLMFKPPREDTDKWSYEFLVVTYSGLLKSYSISGTLGYKHNYEFSFGSFFRKGVNAFAYSSKHNLYIVAGNCITQSHLASPAASNGLTSWRPLNDYPFYKLSFTFEENSASTLSLWNLLPTFRAPPAPVIFRISISPSCTHLVCLHTDGSVSLWDLPNLQLRKKWSLNEQPGYDAQNPLNPKKLRKFPNELPDFHPVDIGWWSDHAIIIARYSGAVSVCSMSTLKNLLGASPEFLFGQPQITEFYSGKGFIALDCDTLITSKKRKRTPSQDGSLSDPEDSDHSEDELESITLLDYSINLLKALIYSITDIERFQPKRKKSKILQRTYRILGLKSTTPEELYARKIDIEEYDDALNLATTYNLDKDLVYQTQWRKSEFSLEEIKNHLSKVSKRCWVLNECISRVPDTLAAARELLNFGLKGANLETFLSISSNDDGKFIDEKLSELNNASNNIQKIQKINDLLQGLPTDLTDSQKQLINYRRKLLNHLDKLKTYEIIIGDEKKYRKEFYENFRRFSVLENAIKFAKDCNYKAVEVMFTYHGVKLIPHWLAIINCFPETLSPLEYEKLLPECDDAGQLYLLYQKELRPKDWSEKSQFEGIIIKDSSESSESIYDDDPSLSLYKNTELTMNLLTKWYKSRANQIERDSCIVENALDLIKIGVKHRIQGLEGLLIELETLSDLIYKKYLETMSLAQLEKLTDLQKIELLMTKTSEKTFIYDILHYILPFLERRQKYLKKPLEKKLFKEYLLSLSENDLMFPSILFDNLGEDPEILEAIDDVMSLSLDCIYSCINPDMYERARDIFEAVSTPNMGSKESLRAQNPLDVLEKELECLKIFNKYSVRSTIKFINENKENSEIVEVLLHEMAGFLRDKSPPVGEESWTELLNDILEVQGLIFNCIDTEKCFEIVVSTKLSSGVKSSIQECVSLIETRKKEGSLLKVSYARAVDLIVEASKEYFNSSKSLHDPTMDLAKACLNLIEDDNKVVQREFDLINALQVLDEFNLNILPLQVRNHKNKLKLIDNCLETCEGAYKRQQRLLTLATYLHIDDHNQKQREGKILQLIALKSLEIPDFTVCSSTCKQLIDSSYSPAWSIIHQLASCESYINLYFKKTCFWFAITHGPSEILENSLKQVHLLEIQLLNKNLETWMNTQDYDLETSPVQDIDSDEDFTDAVTTPQSETKQFVPKIFEKSTDLVKNSAQIFNQSLGILKNVSNQNFWKSALNINRKNVFEDTYDVDEDANLERYRGQLQSFPYFYQSLHDNCLISRIDTRYSKYSQPDFDNTKLKMCQTLVRVALLSETACYGLEISDIRHFFVECCSHVIDDDWLLGFSYLLSCGENVKEVFKELKISHLHVQTFIYFFGVKLFRVLSPEDDKFFFYDPMELMRFVIHRASGDGHEEMKKSVIYWVNKLNEDNVEEEKNLIEDEQEEKEFKSEINDFGGNSNESKSREECFKVVEGDWGDDAWGDDFSVDVEKKEIIENCENEVYKICNNEKIDSIKNFEVNEEDGAWGDAEFSDDVDKILLEREELKNIEDDDKIVCQGLKSTEEDELLKIGEDVDEGWGEEAGWDDDWPEDVEEVDKRKKKEIEEEMGINEDKNPEEIINSVKSSEDQEWVEDEAGWDSWGDFPDIKETKIHPDDEEKLLKSEEILDLSAEDVPIVDDSIEEERFQIFQDLFMNMENKNDYFKVKEVLKRWPRFERPEFICGEKSPVLRMIEKVNWIFDGKRHSKGEIVVLEEYRDLLNGQSIPEEVFNEFIKKFDEKCCLEDKIFLRLSSEVPGLQTEAINLIKSSNLSEFSLSIVEEIFFKNLTSSFPPHHPIYDKILEQMFLNHDLEEVKPNMRILIKKLMDVKHIPYAVALWNQLERVPPALATFESCFQLLMKE